MQGYWLKSTRRRPEFTLVAGTLVCLASLSGPAVRAQDRVRWRFQFDSPISGRFVTAAPDGTIYATDNLRLYALNPDGTLIWSRLGAGGGRPIALGADGTIYTGAASIHALDPDGTLRWTFAPGSQSLLAGPSVGPQGNIYAVDDVHDGGLGAFSVDPAGNLRWDDPGDPAIFSTETGLSNSRIAFAGDRLVFGFFFTGPGGPSVYAYRDGGNQQWYSGDLGLPFRSFPQIDPFGRIIAVRGQVVLMAVSIETGDLIWNASPPQGVSLLVMPSIGSDGTVYTADRVGGDLWALNPDGSTRWFVPGDGSTVETLAVSPDNMTLVVGGSGGFGAASWVRGYDPADGSLLWQADILPEGGANQFVYSRQPAFSPDGRTSYVTTRFGGDASNGYLYAIDITPDGTPAGDIDGDGDVDVSDLGALLAAFGACISDPGFNPAADLNANGCIDIGDLGILLAHFGV